MSKIETWKQKVKEWLEDPEREKIEVCDWGSCQYKAAKDMHDLYKEMLEDNMSRLEIFKVLGIKAEIEEKLTIEEIRDNFTELMEEELDNPVDDDEENEIRENIEKTKVVESVDPFFEMLKKMAWDLWGAAPTIAGLCYEKFKLDDVPKTAGFGPVLNLLAQSENYQIGIVCAILEEDGLVKYEKSFSGFDT